MGSRLTSVAVFTEMDSISRYLKYSSISMYTIETMICRVVTAHTDASWSDAPRTFCFRVAVPKGGGIRIRHAYQNWGN